MKTTRKQNSGTQKLGTMSLVNFEAVYPTLNDCPICRAALLIDDRIGALVAGLVAMLLLHEEFGQKLDRVLGSLFRQRAKSLNEDDFMSDIRRVGTLRAARHFGDFSMVLEVHRK